MTDVGCIVLAGGLSSRFGEDKASARFDGASLLEHVVDGLPASRAETILVLREGQPRPTGTVDRVVFDDPALAAGPLRGIVAGLEVMGPDRAWVVACDLPGIVARLLEALASAARDDLLGVIPEWDRRLQPLCALYSRAALAPLRAAAASGGRSVSAAVDAPGFLRFPEDQVRKFDPQGRSFMNLNTTDALERFRSSR